MNDAWPHPDVFFATTVTGNRGCPCLHRVHGQQGVGAGEEEYGLMCSFKAWELVLQVPRL